MVRIALAVVLFAHGVGHSMGLLQLFRVATINPEWRGDSWLLSGTLGTPVAQLAGAIAWVAAIVGFAAVAAVILGWLPTSWWAPLGIGSAIASLIGLLLFPSAFPTFSSIAALAVDLALLAAVAWFHWSPQELAP
jgi:hypothetical protein